MLLFVLRRCRPAHHGIRTLSNRIEPRQGRSQMDVQPALVPYQQGTWSAFRSRRFRFRNKTRKTKPPSHDEHAQYSPGRNRHLEILQQLALGKALGWPKDGFVWSRRRSRVTAIRARYRIGYRLCIRRTVDGVYTARKTFGERQCQAGVLGLGSL